MTTVERVNSLEDLMAQLISETRETSRIVSETSRKVSETSRIVSETSRKVSETTKNVDALIAGQIEFKEEMKEFKDEMRQSKKDLDKKWGDLANKMGTVVEDLILPNVENSIYNAFNEEINRISARVRRHNKEKKLRIEIDVIASAGNKLYLIETKTTPTRDKIDSFREKQDSGRFIKLFPEYREYTIILIFAAVNISRELREYLFSKNMYPMVMRGDIMEILTQI